MPDDGRLQVRTLLVVRQAPGCPTAMAQLGPPAPGASVYSVPWAEDPPYTATSLLLTGRYAEAAQMSRRIIDTAYQPQVGPRGTSRPTMPARC